MVKILQKIIIIIKVKKINILCVSVTVFFINSKGFSYLKNYLIYSHIYEKIFVCIY